MTLELPGIRFSTQFDPPCLSGTSVRCFDQNFCLLTLSVANHDFFQSIWLFWKIIELTKIVALLDPFYDKIWFHLNFITFNCPWKDLKNRQLAVEKPLLEALFAELKTKTSEEKTKSNQNIDTKPWQSGWTSGQCCRLNLNHCSIIHSNPMKMRSSIRS